MNVFLSYTRILKDLLSKIVNVFFKKKKKIKKWTQKHI